jgi:hypothetical protein
MAIEWPDSDELKQVLDITSDDWDDTLDRVMAAAIAKVKSDIGKWDEDEDEPDDNMAQAALRMAELMALRPEAAADTIKDPTYDRLLTGRRRRFAVG